MCAEGRGGEGVRNGRAERVYCGDGVWRAGGGEGGGRSGRAEKAVGAEMAVGAEKAVGAAARSARNGHEGGRHVCAAACIAAKASSGSGIHSLVIDEKKIRPMALCAGL